MKVAFFWAFRKWNPLVSADCPFEAILLSLKVKESALALL
jgi:hypothetical protein